MFVNVLKGIGVSLILSVYSWAEVPKLRSVERTQDGVKHLKPWGFERPEERFGMVEIRMRVDDRPYVGSHVTLIGQGNRCKYDLDGKSESALRLAVSDQDHSSRNKCRILKPGTYEVASPGMASGRIVIPPLEKGESENVSVHIHQSTPIQRERPTFEIKGRLASRVAHSDSECFATYFDGGRRHFDRLSEDGSFRITGSRTSNQGELLVGCVGVDHALAYVGELDLGKSGHVVVTLGQESTLPQTQQVVLQVPDSMKGKLVAFAREGRELPVAWSYVSQDSATIAIPPGSYQVNVYPNDQTKGEAQKLTIRPGSRTLDLRTLREQ